MRRENNLKPCPGCGGAGELISFPVKDDQLWQVCCRECGFATEMDDDRGISLQRWNRRDIEEQLRTRVIILALLLPVTTAITFMLGLLLGMGG